MHHQDKKLVTSNKFAVVFPGQGSQKVAMLADLAERYDSVRSRFDQASEILGYDLWELTQQGPDSALAVTQVTQPLMLTADIAVWDIWSALTPVAPAFVAGHSLGEYSALVASKAMTFEAALKAVKVRAQAMAEAVPEGEGGMAAVLGLDHETLQLLCEEVTADSGKIVSCVNLNAPGQVVVGGHKEAIDALVKAAKEAGAKRIVPVAMSVPSHCDLMKPAAEQLEAYLASAPVRRPAIKLINNAKLSIETDQQKIKQALVEQVYCPVNWVGVIEQMVAAGVTHIAECGPGKVLCGLNKRIDRSLTLLTLGDVEGIKSALTDVSLLNAQS